VTSRELKGFDYVTVFDRAAERPDSPGLPPRLANSASPHRSSFERASKQRGAPHA